MPDEELGKVGAEAALLWKGGASVEALLKFMREGGLNQPRSADAIASITGVATGDAHVAVIESETWKDQRERNILIKEELEEALLALSKDENADVKIIVHDDGGQLSPEPSAILQKRCSDSESRA